MGLPYGCTHQADQLFKDKWNLTELCTSNKSIYFKGGPINKHHCTPSLSYINGDCTACSLHSEFLTPEEVPQVFQMIQEYMSINARISCFFSKKISLKEAPQWIKQLQKFPIVGLHLQKSNREPDSSMYMLSGILKVTNPFVNTYLSYNLKYPTNHNNNDTSKYNELNSTFKLQTL